MLTPSIKLRIAGNLLSLNDNDLILVNGIITDIKTNKDRKEVYKLISELEEESNYFKEKTINRALNISEDRIEEVIYILELLNLQELTNEDIKRIKSCICGYLKGKKNNF